MTSPYDRLAAVLDSDLPKHERWVLLVYARYAIRDSLSWPGTARVCEETGLSERAVRSAVRKLEAKGLLRFQHLSPHGTKAYLVELPAPRAAPRHDVPPPGTACRPPAPRAESTGTPCRQEGREKGDLTPPPTPPDGGESEEYLRLWDAFERDLEEIGGTPPGYWSDPTEAQVANVCDVLRRRGLPARQRWVRRIMVSLVRLHKERACE